MSNCQEAFFDRWQSFKFPTSTDDLLDFLSEHYPDDWYILDYIPVQMKDSQKYLQFEVTHTCVEQSFAGHNEYDDLEKRYIRVLSLLWGLYDNRCETEVDSDIFSGDIECVCNEDISHNGSSIKLMSIENLTEYRRLAQLSLREKSVHTIFFSDAELIIWVDGLCATVFTRKADTVSLIERISTAEGLYIRKKESEWSMSLS